MTTRLDKSATKAARGDEAQRTSVKIAREERNTRVLLLRKRVLSRGNCCRGAGPAKIKFRPPRREGGERNIEEPALEHEQERYRNVLPIDDGEPNEVGEIDCESHFRDWQK